MVKCVKCPIYIHEGDKLYQFLTKSLLATNSGGGGGGGVKRRQQKHPCKDGSEQNQASSTNVRVALFLKRLYSRRINSADAQCCLFASFLWLPVRKIWDIYNNGNCGMEYPCVYVNSIPNFARVEVGRRSCR